MTASPPPLTVDCYARAASLGAPVDGTLETLREYRCRGVIDDLTVRVWPEEVVLTDYAEETPTVAQYRRFRTWAERAGVSLRPGFTIRERTSIVDEGAVAVLVPPVLCLVIHVDGELAEVVPHRADTGTYTVEDALADLAALDRAPPKRTPTADPATESPTPPTSTPEPWK
jgi:hypothetical protein